MRDFIDGLRRFAAPLIIILASAIAVAIAVSRSSSSPESTVEPSPEASYHRSALLRIWKRFCRLP